MYTAQKTRKENIAEYILYLWQLEDLLRTQMQTDLAMAPEYERLIVSELQLRSNRALLHVR